MSLLAELERLALRTPSRAEFFDEAALRLKRTVAFDGACWHTLDPGSDLITHHRLQDIPDRFRSAGGERVRGRRTSTSSHQLARAERKAATMSEATGGQPERSPRFRDLLTPAGIGPELRSAFVADGATWGALILVRQAGRPDFEQADVELARERLVAVRAGRAPRAGRRGLRGATARGREAPGVIELDAVRRA